jgi:transposase-like protein
MDLATLPDNASSLKFSQKSAHIMGLCLTYHVNLSLSLRKTAQALKDIHNVSISHTMVANYAHAAAAVIKPFVVRYPYERGNTFIGDETYIKVRGVRAFVWFVMDAVSRSVIGFRVSATRAVGDCILAMRMAFGTMEELPEGFKFIADGYSAYPLAAQQFELHDDKVFNITPVIGLANYDAVSKEFRPFKQIVERLNRTFKASYRVSCGYDHYDGADYAVSLWVAYYNFLRPHSASGGRVLNPVKEIIAADNMPARWQMLLSLGQMTILNLQQTA